MKKIKLLALVSLCLVGISVLSSCDENDNQITISSKDVSETTTSKGGLNLNLKADYKVNHLIQKADLSGYELKEEETLNGEIGKTTDVTPKDYSGFILKEKNNVTITADGSAIATIKYDRINHDLTLNVNDNEYGTVSGAGSFPYGTTTSIVATPNPGYEFLEWYDGSRSFSTNKTIEIEIPNNDLEITARFKPSIGTLFRIKYYYQNINNDEYSYDSLTTSTGKTGDLTNVTAPSVTGFVAKEIEQQKIKGDESTVVNVYYDRALTNISLESNNEEYGTVEGTGSYKYGYVASIKAKPNPGYKFDGWYSGSDLYSNKNEEVINVDENNLDLVAKFSKRDDVTYTVNHYQQKIYDTDYLLVESDTTLKGTTSELTNATSKTYEGFEVNSFSQEKINGDGSTVINIYYDRLEYEVANTVNNTSYGKITGNGKYKYGAQVTLVAEREQGYKFIGWYKTGDETPVSILPTYEFNMPTEKIEYEARFEIRTDIAYKVKHYKQKIENDEYEIAETDNLEGIAGNETVAKAKTYEGFDVQTFNQETINVDESTVVSIYYNRKTFSIKVNYDTDHLTLDKDISGTYKYGTTLNIKVTPEAGYVFTGWYNGDTLFDENIELDLTFTMPNTNLNLVGGAQIAKTADYTVNHYLEQKDGTYKLEKTETFNGDSYSKTDAKIIEFSGYSYNPFKQEIINPAGNTKVDIYYSLNSNRIILSTNMEKAGSISGAGLYKSGEEALLVATVNTDYEFVGWYSNGVLKSSDKEFKYVVNEGSIKIEARFKLIEGIENLIIKNEDGKKILVGIKDTTVKELVIPNEIDEIEKGALSGCSNLETLTIPFVGAKRYSSVEPNDGVAFGYIFGSEGYNNCYGISQHDRYGQNSWYCLPKCLKTVNITDTEYIQYGAFSYAERIIFVNLPDKLKGIGNHAFYATYFLLCITIPEGVTYIGDYCFTQTYSLVEIYNLSSVKPDNGDAIGDVNNYMISANRDIFTSLDEKSKIVIDGDYIFRANGNYNYLMLYTGTESKVVLPDSFIYEGKEITKYTIYRYAFYNNTNITSVVLPNSVDGLSDYCFKGCENLKEVYNLTRFNDIRCGSQDRGWVAKYAAAVYRSLDENKKIFMTDDGYYFGVNDDNTITLSAYYGYDYELKLPTNVEINGTTYTTYNIANSAFANNGDIVKVIIPDSVNRIGDSAFKGCGSLEEVVLPNTISRIDHYTFQGCSKLKTIVLPDELTSIGEYAFEGTSSLEEITIPAGVKNLPKRVFYQSGIKKINLQEGLESISTEAFRECTKLLSISFPDSLTNLEGRTFMDCNSLETVHLGKGITKLNDYTFYGCRSLKTINLDNITSLGSYVFYNCDAIETITLPQAITVITNHLFTSCDSLKTIIFKGKITSISDSGLAFCKSLETVELTDSLKSIGTRAFEECESLTKIIIPNSVESIGEMAFKDCIKVTYIVLPSSSKYTNLGKYAVYSCNELETLVISKNIISMDSDAILYCEKLKNIFFDGSASELDNWALKTDSSFSGKKLYYYSSTKPSSGNAWHYDSTGKPVAW